MNTNNNTHKPLFPHTTGIFLSHLLLLCLLALSGPLIAQTPSPFLQALKAQDLARVMMLVEHGVDVNQGLASGKTALMLASRQGSRRDVELLIQAGAKVNARTNNGGTALMYSATQGDTATLRYLLESGAAVNLAGTNGWTAMMLAAVKNHRHSVALLLKSGADPNHQDIYGWSALMRAANLNRGEGVEALLATDQLLINLRDDAGATALHHAAEKNNAQIVKQLLAAGADPGVLDNHNRTAEERARLSGYSKLAQLIRDHHG